MSKQFDTSEVTIRNDLSELENMGLLERVHGEGLLVPTELIIICLRRE